MSILVTIFAHDKNINYLPMVLENVRKLKGSFDICFCYYSSEIKIHEFVNSEYITSYIFERQPVERYDSFDAYFLNGMSSTELYQLAHLRNNLFDAIAEKYDYLMMVDSDIVLKSDALELYRIIITTYIFWLCGNHEWFIKQMKLVSYE